MPSDEFLKKIIIVAFVILVLYWGFTSPDKTNKDWLLFLGPILMTYLFKATRNGGERKSKKAEGTKKPQRQEKPHETDGKKAPPSSRDSLGSSRISWPVNRIRSHAV